MRFGEQFLLSQLPEWDSHYLPYRQLKSLLKLTPSDGTGDLTEFYSLFCRHVTTLGTFFHGHYALLKSKEKIFYKQYTRSFSSSESPHLRLIKHFGIRDACLSSAELTRDYEQLQKFCRLNYEATFRVRTKLQRLDQVFAQQHRKDIDTLLGEQLGYEGVCLREMEKLQELLNHFQHSPKVPQADIQLIDLSETLKLVCSERPDVLPNINAIRGFTREDKDTELGNIIEKLHLEFNGFPDAFQVLLHAFITFSVSCRAWSCTNTLITHALADIKVLIDHDSINHLIRVTGLNYERCNVKYNENSHSKNQFQGAVASLFHDMIQRLGVMAQDILQTKDALGRLPFHYCGQYGLTTICKFILDSLHGQDPSNPKFTKALLATDAAGFTPLHLSSMGRHLDVAMLFLTALDTNLNPTSKKQDLGPAIGYLLMIALKQQDDIMIQFLLAHHRNAVHTPSSGETCLHIACQLGRKDYVEMLLKTPSYQGPNLDIPEVAYGWTPLFMASQRGYLSIVDALLRAGSDGALVDKLGWTAKEHATFRGHFTTAKRFGESKDITAPKQPVRKLCGIQNTPRYPVHPGATYLVVNLGIMQKGRQIQPVDLKYSSGADRDSTLSLVISTSPTSNTSHTLRLPLLDDPVLNTFVFRIDNPSEIRLVFKLLRVSASRDEESTLVGSGMALLPGNNSSCGEHRESLIRECSIPILGKEEMDFLGTITFTPIIVKSFPHLHAPTTTFDYLEKLSTPDLVGHRGLGQNDGERQYLQIGENTAQSFVSAAKLGAAHVEFDVQLTRDLVPVLYHDFSLSESGTDIPIHDLTLEQFMYASKLQSPQDSAGLISEGKKAQDSLNNQRPRSQSLTRAREKGSKEIRDRMKHTVDFVNKGFKPNTRGDFIHTSFATLDDALREVPESVGFNIEIKYPRIHEAVGAGVAPVAIDINTFVDKNLHVISQYAGSRNIILSSFTPEICILLAIKQKAYPVLFITNAGKQPIVDKEQRAGSLQVAVHFAMQWGLAGIVFASDALVMCPRLVDYVKRKGLVCGTYGAFNNIPETVVLQAKAGVDLIVSDRVGQISKVLKSLT